MEFLKLECPNCHAQLNIENGLDTFFCQYCGSKIILSEQNPEIVRAKVEMHKTDTLANLEKAKLQHEMDMKKFDAEERERRRLADNKTSNEVLIICICMIFIGLVIMFFASSLAR